MNFKTILALFGVVLFGAGLVTAIEPTSVNWVSESRWSNASMVTSDITEGGNITVLNIVGTTLTERWAAYWGNVTVGLRLWDGTSTVYQWTPTIAGEVCASTGSAYNFNGAIGTLASTIDSAWSFSGGSDLATNTFNDATNCTLAFEQKNVGSTIKAKHVSGSYYTCAIEDGVSNAKGNLAFCTNLNASGTAYNGQSADYEIMVPTNQTDGTTETYNFYLELN